MKMCLVRKVLSFRINYEVFSRVEWYFEKDRWVLRSPGGTRALFIINTVELCHLFG
jgi:hypothetical protein